MRVIVIIVRILPSSPEDAFGGAPAWTSEKNGGAPDPFGGRGLIVAEDLTDLFNPSSSWQS
jgi:hypothetical protein